MNLPMIKEIGTVITLKRTHVIILVFGLLFSGGLFAERAYASDVPPPGFTAIETAAELAAIGATSGSRSGNYWLSNDIDISHVNWNAIGTFSAPFTGVFDGNGKTISGLWSGNRGSSQGLFGRIDGNGRADGTRGVVKDLTIELDPRGITGAGERKGALAGNIYNGAVVDNVHVRGVNGQSTIQGSGNYIAGFVGVVNSATVRNSSVNDVVVRGFEYQGGFAGAIYGRNNPVRALVEYSLVLDNVVVEDGYTAGGFAGILYEGARLFRSVSYADVYNRSHYAGGLLGKAHNDLLSIPRTTVEQCAAYGDVIADGYVIGGLIGELLHSTVIDAYARGNVTRLDSSAATSGIGGLIGYVSFEGASSNSTIKNTYFSGTVNPSQRPGHSYQRQSLRNGKRSLSWQSRRNDGRLQLF